MPGIHRTPSDSATGLERARLRDPDLFLVAQRGRELVGVVLGRFDGRRGWVFHLAVAKAERRCGTGSALMYEVERRLIRKGCTRVNLLVVTTNSAALQFYKRLGYSTPRVVFMTKALTGASAR